MTIVNKGSSGRLCLSDTESADLLGASGALAYKLLARRERPALHLGRRVVVPTKAVLALLETVEPDRA